MRVGKNKRFQGDIHCRSIRQTILVPRDVLVFSECEDRWFSAVLTRTAVISGHVAVSHAPFCHRCSVQSRTVSCGFDESANVFSRIKDPPHDSFALRAREGVFVGESSERSKTILVLRRNVDVVELELVSSYVETS